MHADVDNHLGISPEGTHENEDGLTVQQAATQWGVSVNTVRRWIKAGRVYAEQVPTPAGFVHRVSSRRVPTASTHQGVPNLVPDVARAEAMTSHSRALLESVMAELAESRKRIEVLAVENGRLQAELSQAREQLALQAPKEEPADGGTESAQYAPNLIPDALAPERRPWWKFWG
jgi:hypothetical protein